MWPEPGSSSLLVSPASASPSLFNEGLVSASRWRLAYIPQHFYSRFTLLVMLGFDQHESELLMPGCTPCWTEAWEHRERVDSQLGIVLWTIQVQGQGPSMVDSARKS